MNGGFIDLNGILNVVWVILLRLNGFWEFWNSCMGLEWDYMGLNGGILT